MKNLVIIGAFVVVFIYVYRKTNVPTATVSTGSVTTLQPTNVPSVGPSDGGNTYPGMMGATYTPIPGSPGLLMPVVNSTFVATNGVRAQPQYVS